MSDRRVALVTGATSGIGRATAFRLARDGFDIAAIGRREARLEFIREELASHSARCLPLAVDLSVEGSPTRAVKAALDQFGRLDVVVAAAGHGRGYGPVGEADDSQWASSITVSLTSVMDLTAAASEALRDNGGTLVLVGSIFGVDPAPGYAAYAAAKHGLRGFARSIRREQSLGRARVCLINPGTTNTEFASVLRGDAEPIVHDPSVWGFDPLVPEDVAEAVAWVISQPPHVNIEELTIRATQDRQA